MTTAGAWRLVRLHLRTRRLSLVAWPIAVAAVLYASANAIPALFPTPASLELYAATLGDSAAAWAFNGRGYDLGTFGGVLVYEVGFIGMLLLPVAGVHLAIAMTRTEEEAGRVELVTAARVGRLAPLAAAGIVLVCVLLAVLVLTLLALLAAGLPTGTLPAAGSAVYSLGLALHGAWAAGLGLLVAQLARTARGAYGLGIGSVLALYLLRAVLDSVGNRAAAVSPTGWLPELRPFGPTAWWPLLAMAALAALLALVAAVLAARRDMGAGLLTERRGAGRAGRGLRGVAGLHARLARGAVTGWVVALAAWGAAIGLMAGELGTLMADNPALGAVIGGGGNPAAMLGSMILAVLAAVCALQLVGLLGRDEETGRLGLLLARPVPRARVWGSAVGVAALGAGLALAAGAAALALSLAGAGGGASDAGASSALALAPGAAPPGTGASSAVALAGAGGNGGAGGSLVGDALTQVATYLPAVAAPAALWLVLRAWVPSLAGLAWVYLGWCFVSAWLSDVLRLPQVLRDTSVLEVLGPSGVADGRAVPVLVVSGLVVAAVTMSFVGFLRRDLRAG